MNVGASPLVAISAGGKHTCALHATGKLKCWGDAANGELGYGNTDSVGLSNVPADVGFVRVSTTNRVVQIASGAFGNCALLDNGRVRCWGDAMHGGLGYGGNATVYTPAAAGDVSVSRRSA